MSANQTTYIVDKALTEETRRYGIITSCDVCPKHCDATEITVAHWHGFRTYLCPACMSKLDLSDFKVKQ